MEPPTKQYDSSAPTSNPEAKSAIKLNSTKTAIANKIGFNKLKLYILNMFGLIALIILLAMYSQANWRNQVISFLSGNPSHIDQKSSSDSEINNPQNNQQTPIKAAQKKYKTNKLSEIKRQSPYYANNAKNFHVFLQEPTFNFSDQLPVADGEVAVVAARAPNELFEVIEVQEKIADYISQRFHAPFKPIRRLVKITFNTGDISGLDPLLLLAVMATESSFNTLAVSTAGAKGLMQVMAHVHSDKFKYFGKANDAFEPYVNMQVGTRILKDCISRRGDLKGGLKCYVGAKKNGDGGYANKVLHERQRLRNLIEPTLIQAKNENQNKPSTVI